MLREYVTTILSAAIAWKDEKMQNIIIDEEFKSLLPTLDKETYETLEENLIQNGCRDSIVLWNDILIDGHNRYEICTKHDIPYNVISKELDSREAVVIWIISNQMSRRNLSPMQLSHYRGLHYKADKKIQGANRQLNMQESKKAQNGLFIKSTAETLAKQYNVSRNTIKRDAKVSEAIDAIGEISTEAKRMILSGEVKIDKKELEELSFRPEEEISAIAQEIEEGLYKKQKAEDLLPEGSGRADASFIAGIRPLETIIRKILKGADYEPPQIKKTEDRTEMRTALRSYIDKLEDLYKRM
jgi:hypothetical protein